MLSHFLQWSAGQVRIRVRGPSVERFLNVCVRGGVSLWQVARPAPDELTARLSLADFRRLRRLMGRTGCRVHVTGRSGGPFWLRRMQKRWMLTAGALALALVLFVLHSFLWVLEVQAAPGVPVGKLRALLQEQGVYTGAWLASIDVDQVRAALQTSMPEAGVITFVKTGGAMRVSAERAVPTPELRDEQAMTGLVAARSGVVTRVEVTGGQALVQAGDVVVQGQALASPIVPPTREGGAYHRAPAHGRVLAQTEHRAALLCPTTRCGKRYTGRTRVQYALVLGTRRINLYLGSGITGGTCDKIIEKTRLSIGEHLLLPVCLVRQTYRAYDRVPESRPSEAAAAQAAARWRSRLAAGLDGTVTDSSYTCQVLPQAVRLSLRALCEEQIAAERIDETPLPQPPAESLP